MDIADLVKISQRAWSLTILAALHDGVPGRQAALLSKTQAGRTALGQSLSHLIDLKLLERNPGHGHPLRPEYRLTPVGMAAAATAARVLRATPSTPQAPLIRRTWSVPVLAASHSPTPFSEIKARLPRITDRALSQTLKSLQNGDWLQRETNIALDPPRSRYVAVNAGAGISAAALGL